MGRPSGTTSIAITGASALCSLGTDRRSVLASMLEGRTGFVAGDGLESQPEDNPLVGQAAELDPPVGSVPDRAERYLQRAILDALRDSGLGDSAPERTSLVLGTTLGGIRHLGDGMRKDCYTPYGRLNNGSVNMHTLQGTGLPIGGVSVSAACASGLTAIINGALLLQSGEADVVIAGGYDPISEFSLGGFMSLRLVAPERTMPFEAERVGMKVAEGYGIVVLERAEDARARNARPLGWLAGSGERSDAFHLTQPQPDGLGAARALQDALAPTDGAPPEWILAHATATPANDGAEYAAYRATLADRLPGIPVTALKSRLGHTLGAAGALELVLALTAQDSGLLATTAEGTTDREGFPDLNVLRGDPVEHAVDRIAVLSLGFGGADACLRVDRGESGATVATCRDDSVVFTGFGALLPELGALRGIEAGREIKGMPGPVDARAFDGLDDPRATRRLAQISRLARAAGRLAIEDAGLDQLQCADSDALVGSFHGAAEYSLDYYRELIEGGIEMGNPLLFAESVPNIGSAQVSLALGVKGATMTVIGTRTAALEALHLARLRIQCGLAERVLVIGADEYIPTITEVMRHAELLGTPDGEEQQIGSGAIAFVVESERSARDREAEIHGRLTTTGIAWPRSGEVPARIRTGRKLLAEHVGSRRVRTTSSFGPIGRLEHVIASLRSSADQASCEMQSLAPLLSVANALHDELSTAIIASDFHGGSAVATVDPC